jgi:RimJ/RimL family protein N-acetyltransferase
VVSVRHRVKAESRLIGDIGFLNCDQHQKSWIGFTLYPQYRNQGFAREAVVAVLLYSTNFGITEVWASTDPANESSMKLLLSVGFELIEEKRDDIIYRWQKSL